MSFHTDIALIKENARVAAQISVELEKLQNNSEATKDEITFVKSNLNGTTSSASSSSSSPLVIGGSILDVHYHVNEETLEVSK